MLLMVPDSDIEKAVGKKGMEACKGSIIVVMSTVDPHMQRLGISAKRGRE
jgi:hypothetical protein